MTVTADIQADMQAVMLHYARPAAVVRIGVTRVGPSSQAAAVRGWDDQQVSAANVLIRDFEAPIGVPVTYTVTGHDSGGAVVDTSTLTLTVPSGGCSDTWINDLARVSNTQRVVLEAFPELDFPVPASVHDVIGRRAPITSSDIAHTPSFDFSFLTESLDDRDRARAALGNGVPVLLRTPPEDGIGNLYLSVLAYKEQRIVGLATTADRRFVVTGRQVDRPDPELYRPVGLVDYLYVRTTFATYQALKNQRATYDAVLYDWTGKQPIDVVPWPPDDV